jgi:hypothetical protein
MKSIKTHPLRFTALIFFIIFCTLSLFVYLTMGSGSLNSIVEQMLHREQIIARSGAKSIESFIQLSSKSLLILANSDNLSTDQLKFYINSWRGTPLTGLIQTDSSGQIINAVSNTEHLISDGSVASRDYFQKAQKNQTPGIIIGQPVISRVPGANQNYKIPIAVPLFKNNQFNGILSVSISVPILTNDYLNTLKISGQTDIILLDQSGNFLNSVHTDVVGQNIFDYINQHPFLGDKIIVSTLKDKINEIGEHKFDIAIPNLFTGKITRTLIASAPINFGNTTWILAITTPVDDALVFVSPFILKNFLEIAIVFFLSLAITLFLFNRFIKN